MKIKENIITTMEQPETMQEDGDNCCEVWWVTGLTDLLFIVTNV